MELGIDFKNKDLNKRNPTIIEIIVSELPLLKVNSKGLRNKKLNFSDLTTSNPLVFIKFLIPITSSQNANLIFFLTCHIILEIKVFIKTQMSYKPYDFVSYLLT